MKTSNDIAIDHGRSISSYVEEVAAVVLSLDDWPTWIITSKFF